LHYLRTYGGIENGLHYRRDVTFKEDRCRLRIGHAARTMATLNNLVLALILRQGYTNAPAARRRFAAKPLQALKFLTRTKPLALPSRNQKSFWHGSSCQKTRISLVRPYFSNLKIDFEHALAR
jgi:hypothetical protein